MLVQVQSLYSCPICKSETCIPIPVGESTLEDNIRRAMYKSGCGDKFIDCIATDGYLYTEIEIVSSNTNERW